MKKEKNEKKLELKKVTIANLINQEMVKARGGCLTTGATSSDVIGTPDCRPSNNPENCPY